MRPALGGRAPLERVVLEAVDTWGKQVLSARGVQARRKAPIIRHTSITVWGCVRRGPGGSRRDPGGSSERPLTPLPVSPWLTPSKVKAAAMSCHPPIWRQSGLWWIFGCCHTLPGYGAAHLPSHVLQPGGTGGGGGGKGGPLHCAVISPPLTARGTRPVQCLASSGPLRRTPTPFLRQQRSPSAAACADLKCTELS